MIGLSKSHFFNYILNERCKASLSVDLRGEYVKESIDRASGCGET